MAYMCKIMSGKECDACGECEEQPVMEDVYGEEIYRGDKYYSIGGEVVAWDSLRKWMERYVEVAE